MRATPISTRSILRLCAVCLMVAASGCSRANSKRFWVWEGQGKRSATSVEGSEHSCGFPILWQVKTRGTTASRNTMVLGEYFPTIFWYEKVSAGPDPGSGYVAHVQWLRLPILGTSLLGSEAVDNGIWKRVSATDPPRYRQRVRNSFLFLGTSTIDVEHPRPAQ